MNSIKPIRSLPSFPLLLLSLFVLLSLGGEGMGQQTPGGGSGGGVVYVTVAPSGACTAGARIQQVITGAGGTYTCQSITAGVGTWTVLSSGSASGTVTSVNIAGTTNQVAIAGTCNISTSGSCTLSLPSSVVLSGSLSLPGQLTSTETTGTAPFVVASTTAVANLNSSLLLGATWASPAAIGTSTPAAGNFTSMVLTGNLTTNMTGGPFCVHEVSGLLSAVSADCNTGAFSSLTGGTNSSAAMVVGTGASLTVSGSGTITATGLTGSPAIVVSSIVDSGITAGTSPICANGSGGAFTTTGCAGGGGSSAFASLTSGTNTSASMVVGSGSSLVPSGSGTITANGLTGVPSITVNAISATTYNGGAMVGSFSGTPTFSGTPSFSNPLTLPNGTVATTQACTDTSTNVTTDAFFNSCPISLAQLNNSAPAAGQIPCVNSAGANLNWVAASIGNFLYTNSSGNCAFDTLLSDNGTSLIYTGTGGITASKFTLTGPYYMSTVPIAGSGTPAAVGAGNSGEAVSGDGNLYNDLNNAGWGQIAAVPGAGAGTVTPIGASQLLIGASSGVWKATTIPNCPTGLTYNNSSITWGCASTSSVQWGNGFTSQGSNSGTIALGSFTTTWSASGGNWAAHLPASGMGSPFFSVYPTGTTTWAGAPGLFIGMDSSDSAPSSTAGFEINGVSQSSTSPLLSVEGTSCSIIVNSAGQLTTSAGTDCFKVAPTNSALLSSDASGQPTTATAHNVAQALTCANTTTSGTAQSCNTTPNSWTPANDDCLTFTTNTTNSGTGLTVTVNSFGPKSIAIPASGGWTTTLIASIIPTNTPLQMCYASTAGNWNIQQTGNVASAGVALSSLAAATGSNTLANGNNPQVWNWAQTTNSQSAFTLGETTAATGTGDIELNVQTLASSTALPIQITSRGTANGVQMTTGGLLQAIGSGGINATECNGGTCASTTPALSSVTALVSNTTIANGNNTWTVNFANTTNSQTAVTFGETSAATGTSDVEVAASTLAGSTAVPLLVSDSLTGSQTLSALKVTPTWNTTGVVDAAVLVNVTNTASGAGSKLADLQVGGTSEWNVDKGGNSTQAGTLITGTTPTITTPGTGWYLLGTEGTEPASIASGTSGFVMDSTSHCPIQWNNAVNVGCSAALGAAQTFTAVQTISAANGLVLSAMTGTTCLEQVSGVVTSTGSACGSGGGSTALSALTAATGSNSIANGNNPQTWTTAQTTNSQSFLTISEATAATGTGDAQLTLSTATNSTATPLQITQGAISSTALPAALTVTQGTNTSTTGNAPAIAASATWNSSFVNGPLISAAVTNSSSAAGSCIIETFAGTGGATEEACLDTAGNTKLNGNLEGLAAATSLEVTGGLGSTNTAGAVGGLLLKGSDNPNTGSSAKAGYAILAGGGVTATTPNAAALEGVAELAAQYIKGSAVAAFGDVVCGTTTAFNVTDCPTGALNVVGVASSTSNPIGVISNGQALVKFDGTVTLGDIACSPPTGGTAGQAHDGGTLACATGTAIGTIVADSGTITTYTSGQSTAGTAMSTTLALVQLSIGGFGANTTLSNLGTTAINAALLPATTNTIALGSSSDAWSNVFGTLLTTGTAPTVTTPGTGWYILGTEGTEPSSIASGTSGFVMDSTSHCPIVWKNAVNVGCTAGMGGITPASSTGAINVPVNVGWVSCTQATCASTATTLITTGSSTTLYNVQAAVDCTSSTSTATATVNVKYTDPSGTVQTLAPTAAAACTTLGSASVANISAVIEAENATAIQYLTTGVNSPNFQARVAITQLGTN